MRRAHPDAEGQAEEPVHIVPPQRIHLLRERQAPRPFPTGDGASEGLRRRLERPRPDEAVGPVPFPILPIPPFFLSARGAATPHEHYHVSHPRTTAWRFIILGRAPHFGRTVRIQFHKILSEGRSVRYDPDPDDGVLHLSVIVTEDEMRRGRSKRSS